MSTAPSLESFRNSMRIQAERTGRTFQADDTRDMAIVAQRASDMRAAVLYGR